NLSGRLETDALTVSGVPLTRSVVDLSVKPDETPYGARTHHFDIESAELHLYGGTVFVSRGRWRHRWATRKEDGTWLPTRSDFGATLEIDGMNPWRFIPPSSPAMALSLPFVDGGSRGNLKVSGHIVEKDNLLQILVDTERLDLRWPTHPKIPVRQVFSLSGGLNWEQKVGEETDDPVRLLTFRQMRMENGQDRLRVDGEVDLTKQRLAVRGAAHIHDLSYTLGSLGVKGLEGQLDLKGLAVRGPFTDPEGEMNLTWSRARGAGIKLGRFTGKVSLDDGRLGLSEGELTAPWGTAEADAHIQLWNGDISSMDRRMPFRIRRLAVRNLALHKLKPSMNVTSTLTLDGRNLSGDATDPLGTLRGEAVLRGADLRVGQERFRSLKARLRGNERSVSLDQISIVLERGHRVDGSISLNKANRHLQGKLKTDGLP
ncbi:MAG: hypothetical protein VX938_05145, partial [Myxococcota bacterium]|nr:hypothetical protein [Myxococcota bacterium]